MESFAAILAPQPDTRNLCSMPGNVFVDPSAPDEPTCLTNPNPRFARKVPTWNHSSFAEVAYLQKYMVGQPKNHISDLHFEKFTTPSSFQGWRTRLKTEVCSGSNHPRKNALHWRSRCAYFQSPNFEILDAKTACSPEKIIPSSNFKKGSI